MYIMTHFFNSPSKKKKVAYAMVVGKRRDYNENVNTPHNVSFVFLGLALMWFGKFLKLFVRSYINLFLF